LNEKSDNVVEYAPRRRHHLSRLTKQVTLIIFAILIAVLLAPRAYQQIHRKRLAAQMADYVMSAASPVVDHTPTNHAFLLTISLIPVPSSFEEILPASGATLFVGELVDKPGTVRLVRICGSVGSNLTNLITFSSYSINHGDLNDAVVVTQVPLSWDRGRTRLRLFAGQRDLENLSHVTIEYSIDDTKGIIDGWLNDDGTMLFELREDSNPTTQTR